MMGTEPMLNSTGCVLVEYQDRDRGHKTVNDRGHKPDSKSWCISAESCRKVRGRRF